MADFQHEREQFEAHLREAGEHFEGQLREAGEHFKEANEEINRRVKRPLLPAIITGLILGAIVVGGMFYPPAFAVFCVLLISAAAFELATALRDSGRRVPRIPLVILTAGIVITSFWVDAWWHWVLFLVSGALLVVWRIVELIAPKRRASTRAVGADIGAGLFVLGYVAFLSSFITLLLAQPDGQLWVLGFIIIVVATDTAAFAVGVSLGKHPMAPKVSPGKSWEGFGGAALAALIAGVLVSWLLLGQPWWFGLIFGAVLLVTATVGDLAESIIKRDLGVKDMSSWLPGHGGVLDRIDGVILSGAAVYVLYLIVHRASAATMLL